MTTPRRNQVDLHTHTRRSDGVLEPTVLYERMRAYGMRVVAISDHDTLAGVRELRASGLGLRPSPAGPQLIVAVEINTVGGDLLARHGLGRDMTEELHILGFGVALDDEGFEATLARQRDGRRARIALTIERLRSLGMPLEDELGRLALEDVDALGRPHVARALVAAGHAASVDDAFGRYLDVGHVAYVPRQGVGPREAIEAIEEAGGLPVLAHSPSAPDRPDVIAELQAWGLAGIEAHYRTFPPQTVGRMAAFAAERGLLATGGSDYHGDTMSYAEAQATTWVPDPVAARLLEALAR